MKRISEYSYKEVVEALEDAKSIKEVMQNLGLPVNNGNYRIIRRIVEQHDLSLPVFVFGSDQMSKIRKKHTDNEFFVKDSVRTGPAIRKRLIALGVSDRCSMEGCEQEPFWNGKPLVLQVDHIDGDNFNNEFNNLRILCGHCHSQTETYGNRRGKVYRYCGCGDRIPKSSQYCDTCRPVNKGSQVKIDYPAIEDIVRTIKDLGGWSATERFYGIGQNSLRKHLRRNGVEPSTIKYNRKISTSVKDVI